MMHSTQVEEKWHRRNHIQIIYKYLFIIGQLKGQSFNTKFWKIAARKEIIKFLTIQH